MHNPKPEKTQWEQHFLKENILEQPHLQRLSITIHVLMKSWLAKRIRTLATDALSTIESINHTRPKETEKQFFSFFLLLQMPFSKLTDQWDWLVN